MDKDGQAPLNDETALTLLNRIGEGDRSALMTLYDRTSPLLFGLAVRILGDRSTAEEVLLNLYTGIWKHAASYDGGVPVLDWLMAMGHDMAAARIERNRQVKNDPSKGEVEKRVAPDRQTLAQSCMESLVPLQREILELAYFSGMSSDEIAALTGRPLGAVKTHARLGLTALSESLQKENMADGGKE